VALEENRMKLQSARRPARRVQIALSLFLAIILQVGLLISPAGADAPDPDACTYNGQVRKQTLSDGTVQWWVCNIIGGFKWWEPGLAEPGPEEDNEDQYSRSTPPYRAYIDARIGYGNNSHYATVSYELFNPSGTTLTRQIGVRLAIYNRSNGRLCVNGIWHGTTSDHMTFTTRGFWENTCGAGNYEVAAAGRFYSTSLDKWITDYWTYSGRIFFAPARSENSPPSTSAKAP
jgi:hypothetical protein